MPTYKEILRINEQYALDNHKEDSGVKILLLHYAKMKSANLLISMDEEMPEKQYNKFLEGVDLYIAQNIPVQHIIGFEYFFGHKFKVNQDVLIPRSETEELVANVLLFYDEVFETQKIEVADIGTGSGCLAITLDKEEKNMSVTATDISEKALIVARKNNNFLKANVTFKKGDMFEPLTDMKFDIIVSNPPYIPDKEFVEDLIIDNEPTIALFGGEDGLDYYKVILSEANAYLNDRFIIAFEHAFNKAKDLKKLIKKYFKDVEIIQKKDLQGKDRMTFIIKK